MHLRLGHLSYDKLLEIKKFFPYVKIVHSKVPCDACFYVKKKILPFPNSIHKSVNILKLVHMDIWGPMSIPSNECPQIFSHNN